MMFIGSENKNPEAGKDAKPPGVAEPMSRAASVYNDWLIAHLNL
jgi:hypothetical protein